jgi:capsular exopolysaccharide synthesis family protein
MSQLFRASIELGIRRRTPQHASDLGPKTILPEASLPMELAQARIVTPNPSLESRLVALLDPDCLGSEKFRALVTRLDHMRKRHPFRSMQVTSGVVHDGKTTVAANLAVTLAKHLGARTLLVEGDLHRPRTASLLGIGELPGISQWWSQRQTNLTSILYRVGEMPLWFIPAGHVHDRPSAILKSDFFTDAFADIAAQFDWVVVDSTPMLPVIDANLWSKLVDGTLLVIREGGTPIKALKQGLRALDDPTLLGVVVNEAQEFDQPHYDGEYYGSPKHR